MASRAAQDFEAEAEVLRAIAHATRLALLHALIGGERSVGEIEAATGVGQPALSQQLAVLRKADLVETRRDAKQVFYRISVARIASVRALIDALAPLPGEVAGMARPVTPGGVYGRTAATFARVEPRR